MFKKTGFITATIFIGYLFNQFNVPAGWLIGSLSTGIFYGLIVGKMTFRPVTFQFALSFIGANISLLLTLETLHKIYIYFIPLLIIVTLLILLGFYFSLLIIKNSKDINHITAFFCCIPGGASELIGLSQEYGADDRIVATFHSLRIIFLTFSIPITLAFLEPGYKTTQQAISDYPFEFKSLLFLLMIMILSVFLNRWIKIPGGNLLYSIALGFLFSQFIFEIPPAADFVKGIGQALIGGFVGVRFNREVLKRVIAIGPIAIIITIVLFFATFLCAGLFYLLTNLSFPISLISVVPAGAAEMSITAIAFGFDPTIVASLHIIRLIILFFSFPLLLKFFKKYFVKQSD